MAEQGREVAGQVSRRVALKRDHEENFQAGVGLEYAALGGRRAHVGDKVEEGGVDKGGEVGEQAARDGVGSAAELALHPSELTPQG